MSLLPAQPAVPTVRLLHSIVLLLPLGALALWFYHDSLALGPAYHHSWAQADWLALAYRFREDGFDFFHPATYNLMTPGGHTPAGFPLPPFLAAGLMALADSPAPGLMRALTLACGTAGLLALAGLVRRAAARAGAAPVSEWSRGAAGALLVACSPVYVYYQAGFQPSVPAMAAALGGYYCFGRAPWAPEGRTARSWLMAAIGLLALAGAIRTPLMLPWLVVGAHLVLERQDTARRYGWRWVGAAYALSAAWLVGYFFYNEYLTRRYGSAMFLARPLPPRSLAEILMIWAVVVPKWGLVVLSGGQWLALVALVGAVARQQRAAIRRWWAWLIHGGLLFGGGGAYALLMSPQLLDHDYYFIDSLLLPLALAGGAALALLHLPARSGAQWLPALGLAALVGGWAGAARAEQTRRYAGVPGDRGELTRANFAGAGQWLDSLGVTDTAHVTVIDAYSFNLPLLLAHRRGWTVLTTSEEHISAGLANPAQFVITQDTFYRSDAVAGYPLLTERLVRVAGNGRITLWRPRALPEPIFQLTTDLETPLDPVRWQNEAMLTTAGPAHSGRTASELRADPSYSVGMKGTAAEVGVRTGDYLLARCFVWLPVDAPRADVKLVVSLEDATGAMYAWQGLPLAELAHGTGRWNALGGAFVVPPVRAATDILRVYVLKTGAAPVYVDDFDLTVVRP
ncbi:MAG: hypothetical protein H7330_12690 [Hymenobacteraceae bacterium]|nr:hypothetical protein [Hymenobacteraceae bacterium]